jgi:hypothetical protein
MASDRGDDDNSSALVFEESRLWGKQLFCLFLSDANVYLLAIIKWHLWNIFKSNLIYECQTTLINVRLRAINTSYYMLQPTCCGSLVNNMFGLSSPIFKNDVHT